MKTNLHPVKSLVAAAALTAAGVVAAAVADEPATVTVEPAATVTAEPAVAATPAGTTGAQASVAIDCGGYDAAGQLVSPEAAAITRAPVNPQGFVEIPEVCGGYTQDGRFVGDD